MLVLCDRILNTNEHEFKIFELIVSSKQKLQCCGLLEGPLDGAVKLHHHSQAQECFGLWPCCAT